MRGLRIELIQLLHVAIQAGVNVVPLAELPIERSVRLEILVKGLGIALECGNVLPDVVHHGILEGMNLLLDPEGFVDNIVPKHGRALKVLNGWLAVHLPEIEGNPVTLEQHHHVTERPEGGIHRAHLLPYVPDVAHNGHQSLLGFRWVLVKTFIHLMLEVVHFLKLLRNVLLNVPGVKVHPLGNPSSHSLLDGLSVDTKKVHIIDVLEPLDFVLNVEVLLNLLVKKRKVENLPSLGDGRLLNGCLDDFAILVLLALIVARLENGNLLLLDGS
mmetsp:Transcript_9360/g.19007  ORF Transcript_9360/g.19007 Transcript_9360/m.19007 type:complete len:272 (+) Transcript_9360:9941-10756(+)